MCRALRNAIWLQASVRLRLICQTLSSSALKTSAGSLYVRSGRFFSNHSLSSRGMSEKLLHASTSAFFEVGYSTCLFACSRAPFKALMVFPNYNWPAFDITFDRSTSQPLNLRIFRNRDLSVDICCETQSPVLGHWQIFRSVDWPVARQRVQEIARDHEQPMATRRARSTPLTRHLHRQWGGWRQATSRVWKL